MRRARLSVPRPTSSSSPTDIWLPLCVVEVEVVEAEVVEKEGVRLVERFEGKSVELGDRIVLEKWSA
jgi:hypothetical protein